MIAAQEGYATLSADRRYRYLLGRRLGPGHRTALWVMCNPSTADATDDDATIRRVICFTRRERYERLEVVNLFALRSRNPTLLLRDPDPVGPDNDRHIAAAAAQASLVIAAWGALDPCHAHRAITVAGELRDLLAGRGQQLHCLGRTVLGDPRHPLYLPWDAPLEPWSPEGTGRG